MSAPVWAAAVWVAGEAPGLVSDRVAPRVESRAAVKRPHKAAAAPGRHHRARPAHRVHKAHKAHRAHRAHPGKRTAPESGA